MKGDDIGKLAADVRALFESKKIDSAILKKEYRAYHDVPDIDGFISLAKDLFPSLNCGLASLYLRSMLAQGTIVRGRYGNEPHTFLIIDGGLVVDITADQYGGPRVYVGPLQLPWSLEVASDMSL